MAYTVFKILGGQFSDSAELAKEKVANKLKEGGAVTAFIYAGMAGYGAYMVRVKTKWGSDVTSDTKPTFLENIDEITEVTEDNAVNFSGAAGWAIVGGLLTGGVGILAGALLGGRGKSTTFAIKFKDGSQFLCSGKTKDYAKLLADAGKF